MNSPVLGIDPDLNPMSCLALGKVRPLGRRQPAISVCSYVIPATLSGGRLGR
jgi:hypothetical protein